MNSRQFSVGVSDGNQDLRSNTHALSVNAPQSCCAVSLSSPDDLDQLSGNDDQDIAAEGITGDVCDDGGLSSWSEDEPKHGNTSVTKINYNSCVTSYFL